MRTHQILRVEPTSRSRIGDLNDAGYPRVDEAGIRSRQFAQPNARQAAPTNGGVWRDPTGGTTPQGDRQPLVPGDVAGPKGIPQTDISFRVHIKRIRDQKVTGMMVG